MASLMEELINVLEKENEEYKKLLDLSMKKTPVLVSADLEALASITDDEQRYVNSISTLEKKREGCMKDIANVLNRDVNELKLDALIAMLASRPQEQKKLAKIYDDITDTIAQMKRVNEQNKVLIESSLEMVQFNISMVQAMKAAPETANYTRSAYSAGEVMGTNQGRFDSKS